MSIGFHFMAFDVGEINGYDAQSSMTDCYWIREFPFQMRTESAISLHSPRFSYCSVLLLIYSKEFIYWKHNRQSTILRIGIRNRPNENGPAICLKRCRTQLSIECTAPNHTRRMQQFLSYLILLVAIHLIMNLIPTSSWGKHWRSSTVDVLRNPRILYIVQQT